MRKATRLITIAVLCVLASSCGSEKPALDNVTYAEAKVVKHHVESGLPIGRDSDVILQSLEGVYIGENSKAIRTRYNLRTGEEITLIFLLVDGKVVREAVHSGGDWREFAKKIWKRLD